MFTFELFAFPGIIIILTTLYLLKAHVNSLRVHKFKFKFHPDDTNQCLNDKSGNHRILYIDLLEFLFLHRGNFVLITRTELHDRSWQND